MSAVEQNRETTGFLFERLEGEENPPECDEDCSHPAAFRIVAIEQGETFKICKKHSLIAAAKAGGVSP